MGFLFVTPSICQVQDLLSDMLTIKFWGTKKNLLIDSRNMCYMVKIKLLSMSCNLAPDCCTIDTQCRRFSDADKSFIVSILECMLTARMIEPSISFWHAQLLVTSNQHHKKRLVTSYSLTLNKFTLDNVSNMLFKYTLKECLLSIPYKKIQISLSPLL